MIYNLYIDEDGSKIWMQNGEWHRLNGPAAVYFDGNKSWFQNNELHRIDGPAVDWNDREKEWYYWNQYIDCSTQEEFERLIKLRLLW